MAAIDLHVAFLSSKSLTVHHGETKNLDFSERRLDGFQSLRLNNGEDQFHGRQVREFLKRKSDSAGQP